MSSKNNTINNTNINRLDLLLTPEALKIKIPLTEKAANTVIKGRNTIQDILDGRDNRTLIIAGPCSIHDLESAKEYAQRLKKLHDELSDKLYIVMRTYFEKPRTNVGWKGLINDPNLDGTNDMNLGLTKGRELLAWIAELGLPTATEALDPVTPQYIADLISWSAIGARTTESQTHREMASGLSMPVGFKNSTDGSLTAAVNAIISAQSPHTFIGIDNGGNTALLHTNGNPYSHIILRGGKTPNYDKQSVTQCISNLEKANITPRIIIDASHGNSSKDFTKQPGVAKDVIKQIKDGNSSIKGIMLESHLVEGNQKLSNNMVYGQSITDSCISWETTESLLREL
ncbi:3-deoxy-7-phosphoheptulonate synthase [Kangiella taiwanensis]|uniref:Phospho-2-dehydro-3-deoxyheptonate aldolase n=1 Tax=Kangiella taiwanensis TaxID=1079179 RepID=A0ABP8I8X5_9GAMM|nr:3-deoxy-7-phosphoheptulonate synthase [Kangiella taiwanensis]